MESLQKLWRLAVENFHEPQRTMKAIFKKAGAHGALGFAIGYGMGAGAKRYGIIVVPDEFFDQGLAAGITTGLYGAGKSVWEDLSARGQTPSGPA